MKASATSVQVSTMAAMPAALNPKCQAVTAASTADNSSTNGERRLIGSPPGGAFPPQPQVADDRDIFQRADGVPAMRAARARRDKVVFLGGGCAFCLRGQVPAIPLPVAHEHNRRAVNHDVEKAANDQAESRGEQSEGERARLHKGQ